MDWIEVITHTTTAGSEAVSDAMISLGAAGTQVEDRADVPDPSKPHGYWEIIDPAMISQLLGAFSGRSLPAELDWMDQDTLARSAEYVSQNYIDPGDLFTTIRADGARVLTLTDEQWDLIQGVALNVYVKDGDGFIDLGLDNIDYDYDGNDLVMYFEGQWMKVEAELKRKGTIEKLIPLSSVLSVELLKEED